MARLLKIKMEPQYTNWKECIKDFLTFKMTQGVSSRTIKDYEWHLGHFFKKYSGWGDNVKLKN
ncbi:hypothetical protein [Desulfosporosinus sp. SB140]|uniref:hypothetical protein n=1 Tax=Desulfosporosinus paludis TaxID=3115649 RepID=UPI00388DED17